ncbi:Hypothetical predicted protein [Podarcis lilfordi]|uniref:Uncharacterized protein n=1 Tax=Podarcis lilfordi TaxID=74358 RepID=A0AA35K4L0_9SAUR|nr:Hypothetical predicted protein [Podarcis lilfordi]
MELRRAQFPGRFGDLVAPRVLSCGSLDHYSLSSLTSTERKLQDSHVQWRPRRCRLLHLFGRNV